MSEILTQEQIDALMASDEYGEASNESIDVSSEEEFQKDYDTLSEAFRVFAENAQTTIQTLINKDVTSEVVESALCQTEPLTGPFAEGALCIKVPYEAGFEGDIFILISKKLTAMLSDLMMMGDGTAEFADEHKDAISEILNQICGAFNTEIGGTLNESLSHGTILVEDLVIDAPPVAEGAGDMVTFKMTIDAGEEHTFFAMIPEELSNTIMQKMAGGGGGADLSGMEEAGLNMDELDELSSVATSFDSDSGPGPGPAQPSFSMPAGANANIDMLLDVELDVCIELGTTQLPIKRVLELAPGSIVELDRMAGEPVDLLVNGKVVAKGEIVVVDESFGIRIVSLVSAEERLKSLR